MQVEPQTTPSFEEKRLYVMEQMPNTGHLVSDNMIDRFYADLKNEEKHRHKDKFSDADFLRAVKMVGIITPEIERFNNRLERIAIFLEEITCAKP